MNEEIPKVIQAIYRVGGELFFDEDTFIKRRCRTNDFAVKTDLG